VHLVLNLLQPAEGSQSRLMNRRSGFEVNMLVKPTKFDDAGTHHLATVSSLLSSHQPEDRALAGAISTDKADVFAGIDLQRRAAQDVLRPIRLMYI